MSDGKNNKSEDNSGTIEIPIVAEPIGHVNPFTEGTIDSVILLFPAPFRIKIHYEKNENQTDIEINAVGSNDFTDYIQMITKVINATKNQINSISKNVEIIYDFYGTLSLYKLTVESPVPPVSGLRLFVSVAFGLIKTYLQVRKSNLSSDQGLDANKLYGFFQKIETTFRKDLPLKTQNSGAIEANKTNKSFLIPSIFDFLLKYNSDMMNHEKHLPQFWELRNLNKEFRCSPVSGLNGLLEKGIVSIYLLRIKSFMNNSNVQKVFKIKDLDNIQKCCVSLLSLTDTTFSPISANSVVPFLIPFTTNYWAIIRNSMEFGYSVEDAKKLLPVLSIFDIFNSNLYASTLLPLKITYSHNEKEESKPFVLLMTNKKLTGTKNNEALFKSFKKIAMKDYKIIDVLYGNTKLDESNKKNKIFDELLNTIFENEVIDLKDQHSMHEYLKLSFKNTADTTTKKVVCEFMPDHIEISSNKVSAVHVSYESETDKCLFLQVIKDAIDSNSEVIFSEEAIEKAGNKLRVFLNDQKKDKESKINDAKKKLVDIRDGKQNKDSTGKLIPKTKPSLARVYGYDWLNVILKIKNNKNLKKDRKEWLLSHNKNDDKNKLMVNVNLLEIR